MKNNDSKNDSFWFSVKESLETLLKSITSSIDNYDENFNTDFYYIKSNNALLRNEDNSPRSYGNIDELAKDIPNYKDKFSVFELDNTDSVVLSIPIGTEVTIIPEKESDIDLLYADEYGWVNKKHLVPIIAADPLWHITLSEKHIYNEMLIVTDSVLPKGSRIFVKYITFIHDNEGKYFSIYLRANQEDTPDHDFWIREKENVLLNEPDVVWEGKILNKKFIEEYNNFLDEELTNKLPHKSDKKKFIENILKQIWYVSTILLANNEILSMDSLPNSEPTVQPEDVYVPHQLIKHTRSFIQELYSVEQSYENAKKWFYRLRVPQYRSQIDNIISPEGTCNVTTFAMMLERLGVRRKDIINSLSKKRNITTYSYEYINRNSKLRRIFKISPNSKKKITDQKKKEIVNAFIEGAQLEDLVEFYRFLFHNRIRRTSIYWNFSLIVNGLLSDVGFNLTSEMIKGNDNISEIKKNVLSTLEDGGAVIYSFLHKGCNFSSSHSHLLFIQSLDGGNFIVDDPYGSVAKDYAKTKERDAYCKIGDREKPKCARIYRNKLSRANNDYWKKDNLMKLISKKRTDFYKGSSNKFQDWKIQENMKYILLIRKINE